MSNAYQTIQTASADHLPSSDQIETSDDNEDFVRDALCSPPPSDGVGSNNSGIDSPPSPSSSSVDRRRRHHLLTTNSMDHENGVGHSNSPYKAAPDGIVVNDDDYDLGNNGHHHSLPSPDDVVTHIPTTKEEKRHDLFQTIAGVAGNVLEWYDFAVFGYFGDIIGDVFFPQQDGNAALVESFVVFGGAFLMRPLGGLMMGYIGDTYGRKKALEVSIFLMAGPTFLMGCLPTYDMVGWLAVVLLSTVRLLQGLSVGGQLMASLVFTVEKHPKSKWGLYGSYVMSAANFGTLMGGIVGVSMRESLTDEQLRTWGWRVPFLSGILVSLCGFYLRYYGDEDSIPGHHHHGGGADDEAPPINPIREAFRKENRLSLLSASLVPILWSGGFYMSFVWMAVFMERLADPPTPHAFAVNACALLLSCCILFPLAGWASDKYGRNRVMAMGGICFGALSPLLIVAIGQGNSFGSFCAQSILGVTLSLWGSPMCAWLVESFPPASRLTSVSIGYNIAQITGGLSPAIATFMVDTFGTNSPGWYLTVLAMLSLVGLFIAPRKLAGIGGIGGGGANDDGGGDYIRGDEDEEKENNGIAAARSSNDGNEGSSSGVMGSPVVGTNGGGGSNNKKSYAVVYS